MLVIIDNFDSFTYNLVQYFGEMGVAIKVIYNNEMTVKQIEDEIDPTRLLISPGPGTPDDAGISLDAIDYFSGRIPILGVCLGHQAIGQHFGGKIIRAPRPVHGKPTNIVHDRRTIFEDIPNEFAAGRYHSLVLDQTMWPEELEISARSPDGIIMGLRHKSMAIEGVQFHPESILTEHGKKLLQNFLKL